MVRHGEAVSAQMDPQRPLSAHGRAEVAELGQLALSRSVRVAELRHSGILRAQQTAEILAGYLKPPGGVHPSAGMLPEDDPEIVKAEIEVAEQPILLVGHLPFMGRLAALLVKGQAARSIGEFPPATMLCCAKTAVGWQIDWQIAPTSR
ncbi:MAG: SixA phosphatase family protein [Candidatus Binatia bacterium]